MILYVFLLTRLVTILVIDHWNALSDMCVTSNTINQFKKLFETGTATGST